MDPFGCPDAMPETGPGVTQRDGGAWRRGVAEVRRGQHQLPDPHNPQRTAAAEALRSEQWLLTLGGKLVDAGYGLLDVSLSSCTTPDFSCERVWGVQSQPLCVG